MRLQVLFALWLVLAGSSIGWARPPDSTSLAGMRPVSLVAADPAALCEAAVTIEEYAARLPARLLQAISLTESGRLDPPSGRVRAWPWTINAEGEGQFFRTRQDAVAAVKALQARGVRSIDVGCLQVNLMYHPDAFTSLDAAFDPRANAQYAARFLNALYGQGKDWAHAIAAYHSETPALGDPYRLLVMARWQNGDLPGVSPIATPGGSPYRDFARDDRVYGAFAPRSLVYGAFAPR
jgi:soluble lytic murein transglycosylase-like protein